MMARRPMVVGLLVLYLSSFLALQLAAEEQIKEDSVGAYSEDITFHPQLDWFFLLTGLGFNAGAGIIIDQHHLLLTAGGNYISHAPFAFPLRSGILWRFQGWSIWPEYYHWRPVTSFLNGEFGQGFKLSAGWQSIDGDFDIVATSRLFTGILNIPNVGNHEVFFGAVGLGFELYRSSELYAEHQIFINLAGGLTTLLHSDDIAYGAHIYLPIQLLNKNIFITPAIGYVDHNNSSLIKASNAVGYSFGYFSTFDVASIVAFDELIVGPTPSKESVGNLALALRLEGRWYFLEPFYIPIISGLYLKAFSDVALIANSRRPLHESIFFYTLGIGVGLEWSTFIINMNAGYERVRGFRFSLNLGTGL